MDTTEALLETKSGNRYIMVAIDHYSKWCEARRWLIMELKLLLGWKMT
jgi:hypothetical protein